MLRIIIISWLTILACQNCMALPGIPGLETNGLQPIVQINRGTGDWYVEVDLLAHQNFSRNTWLRTTNRVGAKVRAWGTNGVEIYLRDPSALAALNLPDQTTVSDIMRGVEWSRQSSQWWRTDLTGVSAGQRYPITTFRLAPQFGIPLTNDIILSLSPLMYKVDRDANAAHLVEFPAIQLRLGADGTVTKLRGPEHE
jgi:hypothetical protein